MSMPRNVSAPIRRSRYSSVLESALVGLGREDAVVQSTRKLRKKRRYESPKRNIPRAFSAPEEEEDPFAHLKLIKSHKKKKRKEISSPVVTRSAAKLKRPRQRHGVLEMAGRTPVTRSMKKKWKRSSLELIEDAKFEVEDVVIQKKLFQSPEPKKKGQEGRKTSRKAKVLKHWRLEWPMEKMEMVMTGQVDGQAARFVVDKREGANKFTSKDGEYVALSGKFDRDAARSAGIPRAVMEMMKDGIPAYFYKKFLPFVKKVEKTGKQDKAVSKPKSSSKKKSAVERTLTYGSPKPSINEVEESIEPPSASTPIQDDDVFETPKPKKARAPVIIKEKKKSVKKNEPEPEPEADVWTTEQLELLIDAKLQIPTTASNFWAQVAQYVPGKSATHCQAKTFEQFRSPPTNRKSAKKPIKRANSEVNSAIPTKIARAGSNKFKKQVREFVEEYEKKHVDDLFETTPSKEGLPELPEFDSIKSPELATPSHSFDDDSEMDDEAPGLLKKLSSRRRDDIDSYVLGINRQHVAGGGVMVAGKVRRVTSMVTPVKPVKANAMSSKKKAVMLVEDVGSHFLKGVVSPGGTTHVRIEKDGSSSEDEDDNYHSSDEEEDFDIP